MKILFLHNTYQYKGGEDTTLDMENDLLVKMGHQTKVLLFNNNELDSITKKIKTGFSSFYNFNSAQALKKAVNEFKPDIIHIHNLFFRASPSVLYQAAAMQIPVVLTVQNYRFLCANALLLRNNHICELCTQKKFPVHGIRYKCYRNSSVESALVTGITGFHKLIQTWSRKINTIIVPSAFLKQKLSNSSFNFPDNRIIVKPNFISDQAIYPAVKEKFFLFVGRLSKEKGIDVLLECFSNTPGINLIIAGDGPEKERVISVCKKNENIKYAGQLSKPEIMDLMKKSRALIFPSIWYEGLPLTIIEALAAGTPVIASRLGAMTELITHNFNGLHCMHNDWKELQQCVLIINSSPELQQTLSHNARISYENKYHPDVHYKSIMEIYHQAINNYKKNG